MNASRLLLAAALLATGLTACARSEPEAAPELNLADEAGVTETEIAADPLPADPAPPVTTTNATAELAPEATPPEETPAPDEQMLDDAAATGMTARSARGEEEPDAAGNAVVE